MLPRSERHDDDDDDDYHDHNQDYDYDCHEGDEGDCKDNSAAKIRKTCEEEYDDDHIYNEDYHFHNEDCDGLFTDLDLSEFPMDKKGKTGPV